MKRTVLHSDPSFARHGFTVQRGVIDRELTSAAVRRLNMEIARLGLSRRDIELGSGGTFFPHLRWEPEVLAMQDEVARIVHPQPGEQWADPQLLMRFPEDGTPGQPWAHLDQPPPWAGVRTYRVIAGAALSDTRALDGCLAVWPGSHVAPGDRPATIELHRGDLVLMHPQLWHAPTRNAGPWIRYAAYFRLLTAEPCITDAGEVDSHEVG
jgi:ectoine hydroxylase-related dioxygenase (phytanoyl-CoA dioxygenase family)